jgi:hypothetical protein
LQKYLRRCSTYFAKDPKQLFLVDALGAALSAVLLGVVLVNYEPIFGIPSDSLSLLAAVPYFIAVYDVVCYFALTINYTPYLKIIAVANAAYCVLSLTVAYHDRYTSIPWVGHTCS